MSDGTRRGPSGSTDPGGSGPDRLAPEDAFALLGNETRVAILQALAEADGPLGFTALRERVGMGDSGQFNYHLGKLVDRFVRRPSGSEGDGYALTIAGKQVVGALLAGTYTASPTIEPLELDEPCPLCGGDVVAGYEAEVVTMRCTDCDDWLNQFPFPPGTLEEYEREALPLAFDRWLRTSLGRVVDGFCPTCSGRMMRSLVVDPDYLEGVRADFSCTRCSGSFKASVLAPLMYHPAFVAFAYEHGIDPATTATWQLVGRLDLEVEIVDEAPPRVRGTVDLDGDRLVVDVTDRLEIEVVEGGTATG